MIFFVVVLRNIILKEFMKLFEPVKLKWDLGTYFEEKVPLCSTVITFNFQSLIKFYLVKMMSLFYMIMCRLHVP